MTPRHILVLILATGCLTGCTTVRTSDDQFPFVAAAKAFELSPYYVVSTLQSGSIGLLYCSASFHHKNGRWPSDYAELSNFVDQSAGYLVLGDYERVDLKSLPNDGFEVRYVRPGQTNEHKFTILTPHETK
jgi:hypothetical protein